MGTIFSNSTTKKLLLVCLGLLTLSQPLLARTLPDGVIPFKSAGQAKEVSRQRIYDAVLQIDEIDPVDMGAEASFRCDDPNALTIWAKGTLTVANTPRRIRGICVSTNYKDIEVFAGEGYLKGILNSQQRTITGRADFNNGLFDVSLKPQGAPQGSQVVKEFVICESPDYEKATCSPRNRRGKILAVTLVENISSRICLEGLNWGSTADHVWVTAGCRAEFKIDILIP